MRPVAWQMRVARRLREEGPLVDPLEDLSGKFMSFKLKGSRQIVCLHIYSFRLVHLFVQSSSIPPPLSCSVQQLC